MLNEKTLSLQALFDLSVNPFIKDSHDRTALEVSQKLLKATISKESEEALKERCNLLRAYEQKYSEENHKSSLNRQTRSKEVIIVEFADTQEASKFKMSFDYGIKPKTTSRSQWKKFNEFNSSCSTNTVSLRPAFDVPGQKICDLYDALTGAKQEEKFPIKSIKFESLTVKPKAKQSKPMPSYLKVIVRFDNNIDGFTRYFDGLPEILNTTSNGIKIQTSDRSNDSLEFSLCGWNQKTFKRKELELLKTKIINYFSEQHFQVGIEEVTAPIQNSIPSSSPFGLFSPSTSISSLPPFTITPSNAFQNKTLPMETEGELPTQTDASWEEALLNFPDTSGLDISLNDVEGVDYSSTTRSPFNNM